ncbi:MAG: hypothetical protein HYW49_03830 [Deltaproteobacteria bacterium]|nr:hypothetical protein [Deltaproteobacteria bacterium]
MERVLFVERELGRCFCGEECINEYFQPTVDLMREEFLKHRSTHDISDESTKRLISYRYLTITEPDEVWLSRTEAGDLHFTYIGHYREKNRQFSYVVVSLALDGEPSFIFLDFATKDEDLVDHYRREVDLRVTASPEASPDVSGITPAIASGDAMGAAKAEQALADGDGAGEEQSRDTDGFLNLEELYLEHRRADDIALSDFGKYENFIEPSMDDPDEIWSAVSDEGVEWWTFIARYTGDVRESFWMIVVCAPGEEQGKKTLEIAFAFPTIDPGLVQQFRKGINSLNKAFGIGWGFGHAA